MPCGYCALHRYNIIPRYQNTTRFIENQLGEEERNPLLQMKLLREHGKI
jgi:vacuolar-type H+-ATPase subunit D/Vma8